MTRTPRAMMRIAQTRSYRLNVKFAMPYRKRQDHAPRTGTHVCLTMTPEPATSTRIPQDENALDGPSAGLPL